MGCALFKKCTTTPNTRNLHEDSPNYYAFIAVRPNAYRLQNKLRRGQNLKTIIEVTSSLEMSTSYVYSLKAVINSSNR